MKYKISYENPNTQYIPIEAEFKVDDKSEVELLFPAWRPGRYELGDFAKNIHGFKVYDDNGKALKAIKTSKNSWSVACNSSDSIRVIYKYFAAELNAGSTFMDDIQLYVNPVNCLVYIRDQQDNPCKLKLNIPDRFEIACGAKHENNEIITSSFHELVDSPFIASANIKHEIFEVNKVIFHIWVQGEINLDLDIVKTDFVKFTRAQINAFDGFPVEEYHYLFQILPIQAYHGVEHQTSTVIALGPTYDLPYALYDELLGVSSHELYHTWNIKAIRPIEMSPYDYSKENYSVLGYVAEGVTTYMGDLFLCKSQVKDFSWYRKEIDKLLQRHFDNFGRFNYSVAESSWDTWLDGYVLGAPNRKVSIYNEGALLSLICDLKIRNGSQNKASLHDVMRKLYFDFGKKNKGYTAEDFKNIIAEFSGSNQDEFFDNYYYGTHSFEPLLVEALEFAGLEIKMKKNPSPSKSILGVKMIQKNNKYSVHQIYPGSCAELGGLMLADEIISINGIHINSDLDKWIKYHEGKQLEITVNRMGRVLTFICPVTNKSYFPVYSIIKKSIPSNLSKRIFKSWSGYKWEELT